MRNTSTYAGALRLNSGTSYQMGNGGGWHSAERTESYTYETERDFLVSAQYSGSASTPRTDTWAYDPAGNRSCMNGNANWTYDNLNRMSASPGMTYTHDILGNRTGRNYLPGQTPQNQSANARLYKWDVLNRMLATASPTAGARYVYRADGMRVEKIADVSLSWVEDPDAETAEASGWWDETYSVNKPTTRYFYDGQMAVEEDFTNGSTNYVKRYGIGARGIDYIDLTEGGTYQGCQFPIYDGHGNMVMTLARNGSSYSTANKRYFEAWGAVDHSSGVQTRNPSQRYCASLGHVEDDESGLTYMRARYYEPGVGRFLSEDPAADGQNWLIYCRNSPTNASDSTGRVAEWRWGWWAAGAALAIASLVLTRRGLGDDGGFGAGANKFMLGASGLSLLATMCFALASLNMDFTRTIQMSNSEFSIFTALLGGIQGVVTLMHAAATSGARTAAAAAVGALFVYGLVILGELIAQQFEEAKS